MVSGSCEDIPVVERGTVQIVPAECRMRVDGVGVGGPQGGLFPGRSQIKRRQIRSVALHSVWWKAAGVGGCDETHQTRYSHWPLTAAPT
jgi:hypothetical protein